MANCHYANFDIAIHGQASPYGVRATYEQYAAVEELALNTSDSYWNACLEQLADIERPLGRSRLEEIGATLFAALFHGDIRDLWLRARTETETGVTGGLRMRLSLPPELGVLPWEGMFDPDRNTMLAVSRRTPVVRVDNLYRYVGAVRSIDTTLPLRLLLVVPDDPSGLIDASGEQNRIHQALSPLEPDGVHVRHLSGRVTVLDLRREVEHFEPEIIHLISHGQSNGLILWQDDHPALISGGVLRMIFESTSSIRLVLLNACATAQSSQRSPSLAWVVSSSRPVSLQSSPCSTMLTTTLQLTLPNSSIQNSWQASVLARSM